LDGNKPLPHIRSKTTVRDADDFDGTIGSLPEWSFDGSSTHQAEGHFSDCILKPVKLYTDPTRENAYVVLCEVYGADHTPHPTNTRCLLDNEQEGDFWFGFEQEYFLWDTLTNLPPGFPPAGFPAPQGPYYCSVGAKNCHGRACVDDHLDACLAAGVNVEGINAEVAAGQWEFQVFAKSARRAGDETWVARYLLERTGENYGFGIEWHPKPFGDLDWNGSGMHANFSNNLLRTCGSQSVYEQICKAFEPVIAEHIAVYGADNAQRLTGLHETQSLDKFSYGVSDRGASIRIPFAVVDAGWNGWLEDRRPASNADPYKVAGVIVKTVKAASANIKA